MHLCCTHHGFSQEALFLATSSWPHPQLSLYLCAPPAKAFISFPTSQPAWPIACRVAVLAHRFPHWFTFLPFLPLFQATPFLLARLRRASCMLLSTHLTSPACATVVQRGVLPVQGTDGPSRACALPLPSPNCTLTTTLALYPSTLCNISRFRVRQPAELHAVMAPPAAAQQPRGKRCASHGEKERAASPAIHNRND